MTPIVRRVDTNIETIFPTGVIHNPIGFNEDRMKAFRVILLTDKPTDGHRLKQYLLDWGNNQVVLRIMQ